MIYLDNASTTQIDSRVLDAMMPYLTDLYGNAGTLYSIGRKSAEAIAKARQQVADSIGAKPEQIIFTSGGTEANNMVFAGLREHLLQSGKTHIVTSQIEHDSVLKAVRNLTSESCTKRDFDSCFIAPRSTGAVSASDIKSALRKETGIVSVIHTNNETGVENPVSEIADVCKEAGVLFHTDAVQAAGCSKLDVNEIGCDFLSLSAHKIHAPKGVGALYIKDLSVMRSMICGGASQEFGLRGGTENVAGIVGFGTACELMQGWLAENVSGVSDMKWYLYAWIEARLNELGLKEILHINGVPAYHGKTLSLRFDGVDAETLLLLLDAKGVCVSAGSACRSHESEPSHVLTSMGIGADDARNSIRISLSRMNKEEVLKAAEIIAMCVVMLRQQS